MRFTILTTSFLLVCLSGSVGVGQETSPPAQPADAETAQSWIEKLESPRYRDRAQATAELRKLGIHAIDALEKTAIEGGSESSDRAIEILKRHHSSEDGILKAAATEALKRIAENSDTSKSAAAKQVLKPAEEETPKQVPKLQQIPVFPKRNMGNINRRSSTKVTIRNGSKEVTVEENGKSIRVVEDRNGVEVEKDDGQGGVSKSKYKDLEELKEKDPDGYRAYEKAIPNGRNRNRDNGFPQGRFGAPQIQVPNFRIPNFPNRGPAFQDFNHRELHDELLEQHKKLHQQLLDRMKQIHGQQPNSQQPSAQPSTPDSQDHRSDDADSEPNQPMKTKVIESIDV